MRHLVEMCREDVGGWENDVAVTYTYDAIGNPTNDGIWEYVWKQGRQLVSMYAEDVGGEANDITADYTYNADGMRIGKRVTKRNYLIHQHSYTATVVAPTCTEVGYTLHECACGYSYQTDPVLRLGHNYVTSTNPKTGETVTKCTRCGDETEVGIIPVLPGKPPVESLGLRMVNNTDSEVRTLDSTVVQEFAYVYNGGTLMQMVIETTVDDGAPATETLSFSYDASGKPMNVIYNGTAYFYAVNLQGDVIAIVDASGTAVVSYRYDSWGNILSTTGTMANTLGESNPLTYRGYVYDHETGLYYVSSRYYDPEIGRWINADNQLSTGSDLTGMNLFAYCGNNPVNRIDPTGEAWWHWALGATVVAACAVATVVTCGGFAAAATAVCMVGSGVAAATTASTVAAAAFIGSSTVYGTAVLAAASSSNSIEEFNAQGNWGTVAATAFGGLTGGYDGYTMSKVQTPTSTPTNTSRGSTGRTEPANLREKLAMEQVKSNPSAGTPLTKITLNDPRWPSSEGWVKMQQIVPTSQGNINIHYVYNQTLKIFDDFKFKP